MAAADERGDVAGAGGAGGGDLAVEARELERERLALERGPGAWVSVAWTASSAMSAVRGSSPAGVRARGLEAVAQVRGGAAGQLAGEGAVKV